MAAARESVVDRVEFIADAGETKTHRVRRGDSLFTIAKKYKTTVGWIREVNDLGGRRKLRIGQRIQVPDRSRRKTPDVRTIVAKKDTVTSPVAAATPAPTSVDGAKIAIEKTTAADAPSSTSASVPATVAQTAMPSDGDIPAGETVPETPEKIAQEPATSKTEIVTDKGVYYVVQPGDSLYSIAQEYDSSVSELRKMNKIKRGRVLKVGARILVPKDDRLPETPEGDVKPDANAQQTPANVEDDTTEQGPDSSINNTQQAATVAGEAKPSAQPVVGRTANPMAAGKISRDARVSADRAPNSARKAASPEREARTHVVRRGENLFRIARKYNVSMKAIQTQNGLRSASELSVGRRLVIPE